MCVKSFHSSQESLSPEHKGLVSAAGGNAHTGPPTEAPSGGGGGWWLLLKPALPRLCAYTKSTTQRIRGERESGNQQGGGGENRKEESGGKGAMRRRLNQSGSKEKEQGRGGGLSGSVTLIQDHWQLYFKGNSQNCSTVLYNCRMSILLLDIMPKMIKGMLGSDRHLDKERFQQRCCLKCHASNTSEHIRNKTRRH